MFAMTLVAAILAALPVPALAATCGGSMYYGSCGAFAKKSDCWSGNMCYGRTEADCCDADGGAVAGLVIGLLIGLGTSHARLASLARLADKGVLHTAHAGVIGGCGLRNMTNHPRSAAGGIRGVVGQC